MKIMTKVVHCKKEPYDVYIGRGYHSKWGNPFSHKENTLAKYKVKSRDESIKSYEKWITEGEGIILLNDLHELKNKTLGCWCKPCKYMGCHGDVLAKLVSIHLPDQPLF